MEAIEAVQQAIWELLVQGGFKRENGLGPQTHFRRENCVVTILNQGFGELDWIVSVAIPEKDEDHDPLVGYTGPEPATVAAYRISGNVGRCSASTRLPEEGEPRGRKVEVVAADVGQVVDRLVRESVEAVREHLARS